MKIEERLENWARSQRNGGGGDGGGDSLVASIYFPTVRGTTIDSTVDLADATMVETAVRRLMPQDRKLLQMHFVWRMPEPVICRRLGLKVRPKVRPRVSLTTVFDLAFAHAKRALEEMLRELKHPTREFVSMQSIIDKLKSNPLAETE
ncbi:hypothetical protein G5S35_08275 [Paraburkholderia tropica]|uniref:hypothetical protein n=1 Tax=Paraburkholderia tropica TaxID=92647 RepID=UPI001602C438|nr:hypothetical protein [Paraburkholderia tropica]QNB11574.1 hypothetical protein G5S35_08275 [Paraburkholderia tropica]